MDTIARSLQFLMPQAVAMKAAFRRLGSISQSCSSSCRMYWMASRTTSNLSTCCFPETDGTISRRDLNSRSVLDFFFIFGFFTFFFFTLYFLISGFSFNLLFFCRSSSRLCCFFTFSNLFFAFYLFTFFIFAFSITYVLL